MRITLTVMDDSFAIHRFNVESIISLEALEGSFYAITRTAEELSVVAPEGITLKSERVDGGWAMLKVNGPLALNQVGVLAGLSDALAKAGISIFAISTFDTDYLLVKASQLKRAITALESRGFRFRPLKQ